MRVYSKELRPCDFDKVKQLAAMGKSYQEIAQKLRKSIVATIVFCELNNIKSFLKRKETKDSYITTLQEEQAGRRLIKALNKPAVLELAKNTLQEKLKITSTDNYLLVNGRWVSSTIDEIMRATNKTRDLNGFTQITTNPRWEV